MVFKESWLKVTDNSGVLWLNVFQLYKGGLRKKTEEGFFIKGSAKIVLPPIKTYKGFKLKIIKKGAILRALILRTKYNWVKNDSSIYVSFDNSSALITKKKIFKSNYIFGVGFKKLNHQRFLSVFTNIIY